MKFILTVLDTVSIQPYIFATNRLQEMTGASELVELATQEWVYQALEHLWPDRHNVNRETGEIDERRAIEDPSQSLQAELVYAGGGNTLLIFRDEAAAKAFTASLSTRVLKEAPGLQLAAAHLPFDWSEDLGSRVIELIETRLSARKLAPPAAQPLAGLSVSAPCASTGRPAAAQRAVRPGGPPQRISREIAAKLGHSESHTRRLNRVYGRMLEGIYQFPSELDDLAPEARAESYLAVVHADGNSMGRRVKAITAQAGDNRALIQNLRTFSRSVRNAATNALRQVVHALALMNPDDLNPRGSFLPFRPLISGGDDITFVCRGDLGISLAAIFLQAFEAAEINGLPEGSLHPTACAGISIVKLHYPFSLAYQMAEDLCKNAKRSIPSGEEYSAIDWHFSSAGLSGSLEGIRQRQYQAPGAGMLYLRPLSLRPVEYDVDGRAWLERVEPLAAEFHKRWLAGRNKAKDLHEALRAGPEAVKEFLHTYNEIALPPLIPGSPTYTQDGWNAGRCGYFDALEIMDHYTRVPYEVKHATETAH